MDSARGGLHHKVIYWLAKSVLRLVDWHIEGELPPLRKYVAIGAPHTSFWDLPLCLAVMAVGSGGFATIRIAWIGKHTIFRGPFGALLRKLGGIPVNREAGHHVLKAVLRAFEQREQMVLILAPEGTRKRVNYWKPGFYYIASLARVPIVCGYLDYQRKAAGIGPVLEPSGDVEADMQIIRDFYVQVHARHPEKVGPIRLPPRAEVLLHDAP